MTELPPDSPSAALPQMISLSEIEAVACPCGWAQRAFGHDAGTSVSVHYTQITQAARTHYHREHHEIYVVLDHAAHATIELNGQSYPLTKLLAISIPPLVRHRIVGEATIINIVSPPFDPADEWFDSSDLNCAGLNCADMISADTSSTLPMEIHHV